MAERKSPEESSTNFPVGTKKKGNDGKMWVVSADANGRHRWVPVVSAAKPAVTKPTDANSRHGWVPVVSAAKPAVTKPAVTKNLPVILRFQKSELGQIVTPFRYYKERQINLGPSDGGVIIASWKYVKSLDQINPAKVEGNLYTNNDKVFIAKNGNWVEVHNPGRFTSAFDYYSQFKPVKKLFDIAEVIQKLAEVSAELRKQEIFIVIGGWAPVFNFGDWMSEDTIMSIANEPDYAKKYPSKRGEHSEYEAVRKVSYMNCYDNDLHDAECDEGVLYLSHSILSRHLPVLKSVMTKQFGNRFEYIKSSRSIEIRLRKLR